VCTLKEFIKISIFARKPTKGGMLAKEKKEKIAVKANNGFIVDKEDKSPIVRDLKLLSKVLRPIKMDQMQKLVNK